MYCIIQGIKNLNLNTIHCMLLKELRNKLKLVLISLPMQIFDDLLREGRQIFIWQTFDYLFKSSSHQI